MMRGLIFMRLAALAATAAVKRDDDNWNQDGTPKYKHVAIFSVDGLHASDVDKWLARGLSNMSKLLDIGYRWTDAYTTFPSDSFPG